MKKALFGVIILLLAGSQLFAQTNFAQLKDLCDSQESILKQVKKPSTFGFIEVSESSDPGGSSVTLRAFGDAYSYTFAQANVKLVMGAKATTPQLYIGNAGPNLQIALVRTYEAGDIYGQNELYFLDGPTQSLYEVSLPGKYIEKAIPFENGLIVEQTSGGYHSPTYKKFYSIISLDNGIIKTTTFQKIISTEK